MLVFVLVCITLCPFKFCNPLDEESCLLCFYCLLDVLLCKCPVVLCVVVWTAVCDCGIS